MINLAQNLASNDSLLLVYSAMAVLLVFKRNKKVKTIKRDRKGPLY